MKCLHYLVLVSFAAETSSIVALAVGVAAQATQRLPEPSAQLLALPDTSENGSPGFGLIAFAEGLGLFAFFAFAVWAP